MVGSVPEVMGSISLIHFMAETEEESRSDNTQKATSSLDDNKDFVDNLGVYKNRSKYFENLNGNFGEKVHHHSKVVSM